MRYEVDQSMSKLTMSNKFFAYIIPALAVVVAFVSIEYPKISDYTDRQLHVYFLDVGAGDSFLVKTPTKRLVLIDGGPNASRVNFKLGDVFPFWVRRLDAVIATHSHADHITGLITILEIYDVGCVLYGDWDGLGAGSASFAEPAISQTEENFRRVIIQKNLEEALYPCDPDNILPGDTDVFFDIFDAKDTFRKANVAKNQNLESKMIFLTYNDVQILFTSDAEIPVQEEFMKHTFQVHGKNLPDIEIIKMPHQASIDSLYLPLLEGLKPDTAVLSIGKNSWGHPHAKTLQVYNDLGIKILRTDVQGNIEISTNGYKVDFYLQF